MPENLTRAQIKKVLKTNRRMNGLARELGVSHGSVSLVLSGKSKSQRIMAAARVVAQELIERTAQ